MKFESVIEYLQPLIPELVQGKTVFINQMPMNPEIGVLFKQSFAGTEIDPELTGRRRAKFQVAVRCKKYDQGKILVDKIVKELTVREVQMNGIFVHVMRALNEPVSYMLTVGNNYEFSVNLSAIYDIVE